MQIERLSADIHLKHRPRTGNDYSSGTITGYANVLSGVFKTAKRWNMIDNNPCQDARKPKKKQEETGLKYFTPEQSLMFLKSLNMSYEVTYKGHQRIDDTGKPYYVNEYTVVLCQDLVQVKMRNFSPF